MAFGDGLNMNMVWERGKQLRTPGFLSYEIS